MSSKEVINFEVPRGSRKEYTELHFHISALGRTSFRGVKNSSSTPIPVKEEKILEMFGKTPERQEVPALWSNVDLDIKEVEVNIIGVIGKNEDEDIYRAEGLKVGIPASELEWQEKKDETAEDDDPEKEQLKKDVEDLKSELQMLRDEIQSERQEHKQELVDLRRELSGGVDTDELERLRNENSDKDKQIESLQEDLEERDGTIQELREQLNGQPDSRSTIAERTGRAIRGPIPARFWGRRGSIRSDEFERRRDRRTGAAAGILAVAAAIGLTAFLWGEHEENQGPEHKPAVTLPATPNIKHDKTAGTGSRHVLLFRNGQAFKVSLPGNLLERKNADGSYRLIDTEGRTVVPHVYADRQGNLDKDSKMLIRINPFHHFRLKQKQYEYHTPGTGFDRRYETVVENQ